MRNPIQKSLCVQSIQPIFIFENANTHSAKQYFKRAVHEKQFFVVLLCNVTLMLLLLLGLLGCLLFWLGVWQMLKRLPEVEFRSVMQRY